MATDIRIVVFDPVAQAVVIDAWVGMGSTLARVTEILGRPADTARVGMESWGRIDGEQAVAIAEAHYVNGATPEQVRRWLSQYPSDRYGWTIFRDY